MLRVKGLKKDFGPVRAVRGVSFTLEKGRLPAAGRGNGRDRAGTRRLYPRPPRLLPVAHRDGPPRPDRARVGRDRGGLGGEGQDLVRTAPLRPRSSRPASRGLLLRQRQEVRRRAESRREARTPRRRRALFRPRSPVHQKNARPPRRGPEPEDGRSSELAHADRGGSDLRRRHRPPEGGDCGPLRSRFPLAGLRAGADRGPGIGLSESDRGLNPRLPISRSPAFRWPGRSSPGTRAAPRGPWYIPSRT
jgi:hypothetical protein